MHRSVSEESHCDRRYAARALSKDADRYDRAERRSNRQAKRLARKAKEARKELRSMRKKFSKLREPHAALGLNL